MKYLNLALAFLVLSSVASAAVLPLSPLRAAHMELPSSFSTEDWKNGGKMLAYMVNPFKKTIAAQLNNGEAFSTFKIVKYSVKPSGSSTDYQFVIDIAGGRFLLVQIHSDLLGNNSLTGAYEIDTAPKAQQLSETITEDTYKVPTAEEIKADMDRKLAGSPGFWSLEKGADDKSNGLVAAKRIEIENQANSGNTFKQFNVTSYYSLFEQGKGFQYRINIETEFGNLEVKMSQPLFAESPSITGITKSY